MSSSPAPQTSHALQAAWFATAVNVPASQVEQVRSPVPLPGVATRAPGAHSVHGSHALALSVGE